MAYVASEEEKQRDQYGNPIDPLASTVGGSIAPGSASSGTAPAPAVTAPASKFVNFSQYLAANQPAAQATAQGIASNVDSAAGGVVAGTQKLVGDFNSQVGANTGHFKGGPSEAGAALTYSGPRSLSDVGGGQPFDALSQSADDARTKVQQSQTDSGRQALMPSGNGFDAALAGQAAPSAFAALRSKYGNFGSYLDDAATGAAARASAAEATTQDAASKYQAANDKAAAQKAAADAAAAKAAAEAQAKKDQLSAFVSTFNSPRRPNYKEFSSQYLTGVMDTGDFKISRDTYDKMSDAEVTRYGQLMNNALRKNNKGGGATTEGDLRAFNQEMGNKYKGSALQRLQRAGGLRRL